jgi:very-short-patch-repair endonuclease
MRNGKMNWTEAEIAKLEREGKVQVDRVRSAPRTKSPLQLEAEKARREALEREMVLVLKVLMQERPHMKKIPLEREYKFHPDRRWRFDFAWRDIDVAIEVEGGTWQHGRHNRPQGYENDAEKYNEATRLGWRVYRFTGDMVRDGRALAFLKKVFVPF